MLNDYLGILFFDLMLFLCIIFMWIGIKEIKQQKKDYCLYNRKVTKLLLKTLKNYDK